MSSIKAAALAFQGFGQACINLMRVEVESYYRRAVDLGIDRETAEQTLRREMTIASASPRATSLDAIERASRKIAKGNETHDRS